MLALIGESGCGKTTVEQYFVDNYGMQRAISITTRPIREGEVDGVNYFFKTAEELGIMMANNEIVELITFMGNTYALDRGQVQSDRIVVVAPEGLRQLLEFPDLNVFSVYMSAPDEVREQRMRNRGDAEENIQKRLIHDREVFAGIADKVSVTVDVSGVEVVPLAEQIRALYQNKGV